MSKATRTRAAELLAAALALTMALATVPATVLAVPPLATPLPTAVSAPLAADDNIPGVPLSGFASTFTGTLNATSEAHDVFSVALGVGDTLSVSISAPASTYMDLFLYKPGSLTVANEAGIVYWSDSSPDYVYPYGFDFKVDPAQGYSAGTYYLDAFAGAGSGTYTLSWRIIPEDGNNDIPDAQPLTPTPVSGWATSAWLDAYPGSANPGTFVDGFDVYSVALTEGDQFTAAVATTDKDLSMEALLYPPHATNVDSDGQVGYTDAWVASSDLIRTAMPDSFSFVVPPGGAGTYYLSAEAWGGNGSYTIAWSKNHNTAVRMYGSSRYETGQAIVRSTSYEATTAIIASGMGYADALSAAGVAGAYGAPLLLTDPRTLSNVVAVQLIEMGVKKVIIIGGTPAVSAAVSTALANGGLSVERIAGADRYATSAACAARVRAIAGPSDAFVVRGDGFADALAVSPFAYTQKMPVLLTKPTALPAEIGAFLDANDVANVYIAGGTPAVSAGVATTIDGLNSGATTVQRIAGADRYATARAVADFGVGKGWNSYGFVGVATGANFPDALAGGVGCGRMGGVLLLTSPTKLSAPTSAALAANEATIKRVAVFGSTTAVSAAVFTSIKSLVP